jgi:hypothetical protein
LRAISSLLIVAFAGCTAIDDFGKFTVGGAADLGTTCMGGCNCVPGTPALGVPDHCAIAPSNLLSCAGVPRAAEVLTLPAGAYTLDSGATPPVLVDSNSGRVMTGAIQGTAAVFCVGSLVADSNARITITGNRLVGIVADSLVRVTAGSFILAGEYAVDASGGHGVAGGSDGGASGNAGSGAGGGRPGTGGPGSGGGGGGAQSPGGLGGSAGGGNLTQGGAGSTTPVVGFGGGGGGKGATTGGGGGGGAGALQISAGWAIQFDQVELNASGGGGGGAGSIGTAGGLAGGGGGGGGGGIVTLEAPMVTINGGCISVMGGPGGGGGAAVGGGNSHAATSCGFIGTAGIAPPMGGGGAMPGTQQPNGANGTGSGGGGGGVGGIGRVTVRSHNPPPFTQPPGVVPAQSYVPAMLP